MRIGGIGGPNWRSGPAITHFLFAFGSVHSAHGTHKKGNQKCLIARPNPFREGIRLKPGRKVRDVAGGIGIPLLNAAQRVAPHNASMTSRAINRRRSDPLRFSISFFSTFIFLPEWRCPYTHQVLGDALSSPGSESDMESFLPSDNPQLIPAPPYRHVWWLKRSFPFSKLCKNI